jgi:iron-sulfur cluster assembly protein
MITITQQAREKTILLLLEQGNSIDTHFIRVGVKGGGCSGLSYELDFDCDIKQGDQIFENDGLRIVCDKKSLLYLLGTELDYSDGLRGKGFEFKNPNAQRVCSCGESFAV